MPIGQARNYPKREGPPLGPDHPRGKGSMDIGDSFQRLVDVTFEWVPRLVGALVVIIITFMIANAVKRLVTRLVGKANLESRVAALPGGSEVTKYLGGRSVASILGIVARWVVIIIGLSVAADVANIHMLSEGIGNVLAYVPRVIAAGIILAVALVLASLAGPFVVKLAGDRPVAAIAKTVIPILIIAVGIFMALTELQIAEPIVVGTYYIVLGAVGLGAALAFGLGGRDHASRFLDETQKKQQ